MDSAFPFFSPATITTDNRLIDSWSVYINIIRLSFDCDSGFLTLLFMIPDRPKKWPL